MTGNRRQDKKQGEEKNQGWRTNDVRRVADRGGFCVLCPFVRCALILQRRCASITGLHCDEETCAISCMHVLGLYDCDKV